MDLGLLLPAFGYLIILTTFLIMGTLTSPGSPWPSSIYSNINDRVWSHPLQEKEEEIADHRQQSKNVACHWATMRDEPIQSLVYWQHSFLRHTLVHLEERM